MMAQLYPRQCFICLHFKGDIRYNQSMNFDPSPQQLQVINSPLDASIFLHGAAGTGKTTTAIQRIVQLIDQGVPARQIIVIIPQRTFINHYQQQLNARLGLKASTITMLTVGSMVRRMVDLHFPAFSQSAGFTHYDQSPNFLTLETSQYYMAHIVRPLLIQENYFSTITIDANRLFSQILDNMNKSAIIGFPLDQISAKLKAAWVGNPSQLRVYDDVQDCAMRFRLFCLENNLLDYSLQLELFRKHLWDENTLKTHLFQQYHHLIADNIEEDNPFSHDLLQDWLPNTQSSLLVFDADAGYRTFLAADTQTAWALKDSCHQVIALTTNHHTTPISEKIQQQFTSLIHNTGENHPEKINHQQLSSFFILPDKKLRFFPQMLDWVTDSVGSLLLQGVKPDQIAILSPYMPDVLRFTLATRLAEQGFPVQTHRPSHTLRDEPASQCILTLTCLSFPEWQINLTRYQLAYAFMAAIDGLDLVRARLLVNEVHRVNKGIITLLAFDQIIEPLRARITYAIGEKYEILRQFLAENHAEESLDGFISRLFGEVLSQQGFGFHTNLEGGNIIANLIESIRKFRWAVGSQMDDNQKLAQEYIQMVAEGVLAAQYLENYQSQDAEAILIAPVQTFLMSNRAVTYQFWLDIGSASWHERLEQPLTNSFVLSRHWQPEKTWTAEDELINNYETLNKWVTGLIRRCKGQVYLGIAELNEGGYESRGLMLRIFNKILNDSLKESRVGNVI